MWEEERKIKRKDGKGEIGREGSGGKKEDEKRNGIRERNGRKVKMKDRKKEERGSEGIEDFLKI